MKLTRHLRDLCSWNHGVHNWQRNLQVASVGGLVIFSIIHLDHGNYIAFGFALFSVLICIWTHLEQRLSNYCFNAFVHIIFGVLLIFSLHSDIDETRVFRETEDRKAVYRSHAIICFFIVLLNFMLAVYDYCNPHHIYISKDIATSLMTEDGGIPTTSRSRCASPRHSNAHKEGSPISRSDILLMPPVKSLNDAYPSSRTKNNNNNELCTTIGSYSGLNASASNTFSSSNKKSNINAGNNDNDLHFTTIISVHPSTPPPPINTIIPSATSIADAPHSFVPRVRGPNPFESSLENTPNHRSCALLPAETALASATYSEEEIVDALIQRPIPAKPDKNNGQISQQQLTGLEKLNALEEGDDLKAKTASALSEFKDLNDSQKTPAISDYEGHSERRSNM